MSRSAPIAGRAPCRRKVDGMRLRAGNLPNRPFDPLLRPVRAAGSARPRLLLFGPPGPTLNGQASGPGRKSSTGLECGRHLRSGIASRRSRKFRSSRSMPASWWRAPCGGRVGGGARELFDMRRRQFMTLGGDPATFPAGPTPSSCSCAKLILLDQTRS